MGANAVTTVPVYVAGEVLTAADLNITNSGIPVFADSTARTAGFGGTGEKVLAEGQYAYLESDNSTSVYDGSNWLAVGASGLVYITGATFTTQSTISMATATFTSTYQNYFVTLVCQASQALTLNIRYNATGSPLTTDYGGAALITGDGGTETLTSNATTSLAVARAFDGTNYNQINLALNVFDATTATHKASCAGTGRCSASGFGQAFTVFGGSRGLTGEAIDGLTFTTSAGTVTGNYKVYGYANS